MRVTRTSVGWRTPDGQPVACAEKLKVLEQNLAEFCAQAQDMLEDAVLMGCDIDQARQVLQDALARIEVRYLSK
ncbi:MAG: hypothetical protein ACM31L_09925 [Actinomycetota bacterium]